MLLKKLTLQGYKTFANKTEFQFDEGITSIVGPNGSGKSNVADAVRWVLGEQSYGELRGKRTVDMIFAGSPSRPRAGMASAVLTLDNSEGWLPIDYAEVEISRRAYRTGENEYFINGGKVRLRDVRDLLATSGLAQRTYTMIGQGLVDRALSLKSDERRALFEEAAGISHYKARRSETLRRLNETQRNIERVQDVLAEIEPRLRSLKRQANRAENYEQVKADLREQLRLWYGYQWEAAKTSLRDARKKAATTEAAWKESRRKLIFVQEQTDQARKRLNHYNNQISSKSASRDSLREQVEHARRQVAILTERQSLVSRQLGEIDAELPDLEAQLARAQEELAHSTGELKEVQTQLQLERSELATFEKSYQVQQNAIVTQQKRVQQLDLAFQAAQRKVSQADGQLEQLGERLAELKGEGADSAESRAKELARTREEIAEFDRQIRALKEENGGFNDARKSIKREREEKIRTLKQRRNEQHKLGQKAVSLSKSVAKLEARVDLLGQMRQKASKVRGKAETLGRIASRMTIPAEYQQAIEAALGARLSALVVPDAANAWQLFADNPKESLVALVANQAASSPMPDAAGDASVGVASELVRFKQEDAALVNALLSTVLIADSADAAIALAQQAGGGAIAVSLDGVVCHPNGVVERPISNTRDSIIAQEKAFRDAQEAVKLEKAQQSKAQESADTAQKAIDAAQTEVNKLNFREQDLITSQQKLSNQINQLQRDLDRRQQHAGFLERQEASKARDIARLEERIAGLEGAKQGNQAAIVSAEKSLTDARIALADMPVGESKQQRTQLQQKISATKTIVDGRRAVVDSRRATLGQIENRLTRQRQRQQSLRNQQQEINLDREESNLRELQAKMRILDEELTPLRSLQTQIRGELSDIEADFLTFQKDTHSQEEVYTEARLSLNQQDNHIENLRERITADLGIVDLSYDEDETVQTPLPMQGVVEKLPVVELLPDGIQDSIQKRRAQLQRMGPINPDAPEEYRTTSERHAFLSEQIEDLRTTEAQLREVIAELDQLTSEEFGKTVERVNGVFRDMFTKLFGGGSAELVLTDPNDLTISGVDIIAQLPRRRTQGLGLLSGGERSLTAAALIFALLKVTPPPFCVMDEVDAALDEANINRFRDALRELSLHTQFIVITHNRGTVQAANTIYGISMGGDSASQVISIKPEDYVQSEMFAN